MNTNKPGTDPTVVSTADSKIQGKHSLLEHVMDSLEVMQLLHICRGTLYNWRRKGIISFSKVGGRVYFETADVYRMLKERKQQKWLPAA